MANVYVVMANDFPDAVFSTLEAAEAYCEKARAAHDDKMRRLYGPRGSYPSIYFRSYVFDVDEFLTDTEAA